MLQRGRPSPLVNLLPRQSCADHYQQSWFPLTFCKGSKRLHSYAKKKWDTQVKMELRKPGNCWEKSLISSLTVLLTNVYPQACFFFFFFNLTFKNHRVQNKHEFCSLPPKYIFTSNHWANCTFEKKMLRFFFPPVTHLVSQITWYEPRWYKLSSHVFLNKWFQYFAQSKCLINIC